MSTTVHSFGVASATLSDMSISLGERYAADVAGEIRAMMGRRGINQTQLAEQMGVTPMWLSRRIKAARVAVDVSDLALIADALQCEVQDLLPRLDSNQQPSGYPLRLVNGDEAA